MNQPEGFSDGSKKICRLLKSLYGLKQAPRCWAEYFSIFLREFGFEQSSVDPCFYMYERDTEKLFLAIYVDDGLIAATNIYLLDKFFKSLNKQFESTSAKRVTCFLGMEIEKLKNGSIFISQEKYINLILEKFNLIAANSDSTPIEPGFDTSDLERVEANAPYREAVGNLIFLQVVSRPDIAYAVNIAARMLDKPCEKYWSLVKRIMRYLKGTVDLGLLYCKNGPFETYCDADYAGDNESRKSTSGIVCKHSSAAKQLM